MSCLFLYKAIYCNLCMNRQLKMELWHYNRGVTRHLRGHLVRPDFRRSGEGGGRFEDDIGGGLLDP